MTADELIMVVEDDPDTLEALQDILTQFGYRSIGAPNGRVALTRLREEGAPQPCVIILDIRMPVMDGWKFRAEQQKDPAIASIPVIFVTADLGAEGAASAAGAAAFVPKPVEVTTLVKAVQRVC
jgi:CheY-like chemotaxis protein